MVFCYIFKEKEISINILYINVFNMIPRKIHWCWFSGEELPKSINVIIKGWHELFPDFEIIKWDKEKYDKIPKKPKYVTDAFKQKKWAFVSDFVRAYALNKEGGWYFDSDLQVISPFLYKYENHRFVSAIEAFGANNPKHDGIQVQAAFLGSEKGHPYLKDIIKYYKTLDFEFDESDYDNVLIAPVIYAKVLEKYGFNYDDCEQTLDEDIFLLSWRNILPHMSHFIKIADKYVHIYAIHQCFHSWVEKSGISDKKIIFANKLRDILERANGRITVNKSQ